MYTAAGVITGLPVQIVPQLPADAALPAMSGDFTAVLAAACAAEPEAGLPEGMQSAAALAWLAGFMNPLQPAIPTAAAVPAVAAEPAVDEEIDTGVVAEAALGILQQMLAPVIAGVAREAGSTAAESNDGEVKIAAPATAATDAALRAVSLASSPATDAAPAVSDTAAAMADPATVEAAQLAAPTAVPLSTMRAKKTEAPLERPGAVKGDGATASVTAEGTASSDTPSESNVGERLIGALVDRASLRTDAATVHGDPDRSAIAGPGLYASTRETVASNPGQVSSRPEVLQATVGTPRWANELGSRLATMSVRGQHEGSLTLSPEHLGPLEVRITVNQDTTNVWFGAQHADTRAALADAMPRLREMFAASGLELGQAGVSQQMPGRESPRNESSGTGARFAGPEVGEAAPSLVSRVSTGLLDTWA